MRLTRSSALTVPPNTPDEPTLVITNRSGRHEQPIEFWLVQFGRRQQLRNEELIQRYWDAGRILHVEDYAPDLLGLMPIVEQRKVFGRYIVGGDYKDRAAAIELTKARIIRESERNAQSYGLKLTEVTWELTELEDTNQVAVELRAFAR